MKRETLRHPKTFDLAARLGIGRDTALGKLTLLWDYCGEVAPRGDIGKWIDAVIAAACDWTGDATAFVQALIDSRWIDVVDDHRLVIHDWPDHCESWVKKKLERAGLTFLPYYTNNTVQTPGGHRADVFDPSNPIQSNPNGLSTSISKGEADVEADDFEIVEDDWEAATVEVKRIAAIVPIKSAEDAELLFKLAVLSRHLMPEKWLAGPLRAIKAKKRIKNRVAYLQSALVKNEAAKGGDFYGLLRRVNVPPEVLRPGKPPPNGPV